MVSATDTPSTPPRAGPAPELALLTTPSNPGSAGTSQLMRKRNVEVVVPYHIKDLKLTENCSIEKFLGVFLGKLQRNGITKSHEELLEEVIQAVLPLANANLKDDGSDGSKMKAELAAYCSTSGEVARYAPFVRASNYALKVLRSCQVASLVDIASADLASEDLVWFQVNDPSYVFGHNSDGTKPGRKPDVVMMILKDLFATHNLRDTEKILAEHVLAKPRANILWRHIRSSWEFKKVKSAIPLSDEFQKGTYTGQRTTKSDEPARDKAEVLAEAEEYGQILRDYMEESNQPGSSIATGSDSGATNETPGNDSKVGKKRSADTPAGGSSKRQASIKPGLTEPKAPAELQATMYAAECMNAHFGRAHAINFVVHDTRVHIWYFDHEGPIQTSAFDIIEDLPFFLVLLFILQRLDEEQWGIITSLSKDPISVPRAGDSKECIDFKVDTTHAMRAHYGISGRCPQIVFGTLEGQNAALKLSNVEVPRPSEVTFIQVARERCAARQLLDVLECLPEVLGTETYDKFNTRHIREALGLTLNNLKHRVPRAILFPYYHSLVSLTSNMDDFMAAFTRLIYCHAILWILGVEHGDISAGNLMYDEKNNVPKLCDYDLSHFSDEPRPYGFSHTGTLRFMASELLADTAMNGSVQKVYRHDVESFAWVLLWILAFFRDGKKVHDNLISVSFRNWANEQNPDAIGNRREACYQEVLHGYQFPPPLSRGSQASAVGFVLTLKQAHGRWISNQGVPLVEFASDVAKERARRELEEIQTLRFGYELLSTRLIADSPHSEALRNQLELCLA
ncbi:hypothetical protein VNI00_004782 [Paramarasmius palmivorus]|uniref:Protein kinase domain-containing protein n=1 Tax=Paramarasmius palmivorus TaxID=297713 RepID=A0AAW0DHY2_9AGAR